MAVPVEGAKIIFKAVMNSFAGINYDYIYPNIPPIIKQQHKKNFNDVYNEDNEGVG